MSLRTTTRLTIQAGQGNRSLRYGHWLLACLLLTATLVVYIPVIQHGGFIWDDDAYVTDNPVLNRPGGFRALWFYPDATPQYYPLVFTSFWVEYHLWGLSSMGYHVTNVLLHVLVAWILWRVLEKLGVKGGYLAALIFALHPVHVESVAWVTERKNVLSGVFYMAALWSYLRCRAGGIGQAGGEYRWRYYVISLLFFVCALLSKTVTASLPAAVVLLMWWKRGRLGRDDWKDIVRLAPMFVLGVGMGLMTAWLEKHQVGAEGQDWSLTLVERFLVAGRALWFYAGKLIWPVSLSFVYTRWQVSQAVWWQYIYPALAAAVVWLLWMLRRRIGLGWLVGVFYFVGTLFPALGFLNVYPHRFSFVADHFQYLASLGLLVPACWLLWLMLERWRSWRRWLVVGLLCVMLSCLGVATWSQGWVYQGMESLWTDTLRKNPDSFLAHDNLGNLLLSEGRIDEAMYHYNQVLRIYPDSAEAWNNLSVVMAGRGETQKQIEYCAKALAIRPDYVDALFNMGNVMLNSDRLVEAEEYYRHALRFSPKFVLAQNNLGLALMRQGKTAEAEVAMQEALRADPNNTDMKRSLEIIRGQAK